jgi:ferredoxin-NADP reductase
MEILYWLQDVREYLRVSRQRKALRQPGQGYDYTADKDTVQRVVSRLHPRRMRLRVADIVQETPGTKTFRLQRIDGPLPPWRPGQYVNLFVDVDGVLTSRPYSISSPPVRPPSTTPGSVTEQADFLELTVRDKPGGFVAPYLLNEVRVGDELETTGPAGTFYHEPLIDGDELVFLAGGSGITPFRSIIRDAVQHDRPLKMHLLYGSRLPDDIIYDQELAELAARPEPVAGRGPSLKYAAVISEPPPGYGGLSGFLTADLIRQQIGDPAGKTFYICGPNVMYDFCAAALAELGVPPHKIRRELYGPPDDVTQEPGWPQHLTADTIFAVEVEGRETIQAPAGEPLLNSLERYGLVVPAVCRAGECSACRVRLLTGQVYMPAHTGLRESDRQHGYIHTCVSYPLEDLRIRI